MRERFDKLMDDFPVNDYRLFHVDFDSGKRIDTSRSARIKMFIEEEIALAISEARKRDVEYIRNMPQGEGIPGVADYLESLAKK